jgi:hypothetical protein
VTEIPVRLVPDEDEPGLFLPFVPVELDGVVGEALLDSGASRSKLVDRPGLRLDEASWPSSVGAFGSELPVLGRTSVSCRLADLDVGTVDAVVVPADHPGHRDLIGQDVLGRYRCGFSLADGLLTLDGPSPRDTHAVHITDRGHVYLDLSWADGPAAASAVFDTGASITVVDEAFARRHAHLFTPVGVSTGTDAAGVEAETPMALMKGPRILGMQLAEARVAIVDLAVANGTLDRPMDIGLGWTVISQCDWFIDHPAARAACLPRSTRLA